MKTRKYRKYNDVTMINDEELRPWIVNKELDIKINDELNKLEATIVAAAPLASQLGNSEIDTTPDELLKFNEYVKKDNWIDIDKQLEIINDNSDSDNNFTLTKDESLLKFIKRYYSNSSRFKNVKISSKLKLNESNNNNQTIDDLLQNKVDMNSYNNNINNNSSKRPSSAKITKNNSNSRPSTANAKSSNNVDSTNQFDNPMVGRIRPSSANAYKSNKYNSFSNINNSTSNNFGNSENFYSLDDTNNNKTINNSRPNTVNSSNLTNSLNISSSTGTLKSFQLPKAKDMKTLRDQYLTSSGIYHIPLHPENNQMAVKSNQEMIEFSRYISKQVRDRNKMDNTWSILSTPGFVEAVGPSNVYQSDTRANFKFTDKLRAATKNADITLGLKKHPLSEWAENAVKNNMKIFIPKATFRT